MIWTPYDWLNKSYSFHMAAVIVIGGKCGLKIEVCRSNQPNKSKLHNYCCIAITFTLKFVLNRLQDGALQL